MLTDSDELGRLFMLHRYDYLREDLDGTWIRERVWADRTDEAMDDIRFVSSTFGTGRYRLFGSCYGEDMWRDETGLLHVTKRGWDRVGNDFKGVYGDIYNERPDLKGRKTLMPPLELGYSTCLLIEGGGFVIEEDD